MAKTINTVLALKDKFSAGVKKAADNAKNMDRKTKMASNTVKKFGRDIMFRDEPDERFSVNIDVAEGEGFYQWLAQFGKNIKIESPDKCIDEYKKFVKAALDMY